MYCRNCGTEIPDGSGYCPSCGAAQTAHTAHEQQTVNSTSYTYTGSEADDIATLTPFQLKAYVKVMSIICYLGWIVLLPILLFKDKPYVRHHANNGLILALLMTIASVVSPIPILGWIAGPAAYIFAFVLMIMGIVHAAKGESFTMPLIGGIRLLK